MERARKVLECDGCGSEHIVREESGERPLGFYIEVAHHHAGGGSGASDIYACSERCIKKAVITALDRAFHG